MEIMKKILPTLVLFWGVFFVELLCSIQDSKVIYYSFYIENIKIFFAYTFAGFIFGNISAMILSKKRKSYYSMIKQSRVVYLKYFAESFFISLFMALLITSTAVINTPSIFASTLLNDKFWFYSLFSFIKNNFGPIYFTTFTTVFMIISFYRFIKTYSAKEGVLKIFSYSISLIIFIYIIFNFGSLNAIGKTENQKNLVIFGIEDLDNSMLRSMVVRDKNSGLHELLSTSYIFKNCFTVATEFLPAFFSIIYSKHPETTMIKYKSNISRQKYFDKKNSLVGLLNQRNYRAAFLGNVNYADIGKFIDKEKSYFYIPDNSKRIIKKANAIKKHPILLSLIKNDIFITLFPEILSLKDFSIKDYNYKNYEEIIKTPKSNFLIFNFLKNTNKYLPYPYYREYDETKNKNLTFLKYFDDIVKEMISELKKGNKYQNTVFVIVGLPGKNCDIKSQNLKMPLIISSQDFKTKRFVLNNYSLLDIFPTIYRLITGAEPRIKLEGYSFFNSSFMKQNILTYDNKKNSIKKISELLQNDSDMDFLNTFQNRTFIRGDYKLDIIPELKNVKYKLFDIKNDPYEKVDLFFIKNSIAKKMVQLYNLKLESLGYKIINGYAVRCCE